MPETGCRTRFLRIQYHAGGRDATALRGESKPGTGFRGGFRGGIRFGGQDSCGRVPGMVTAKETADSQKPPLPGRRSKIPPHVFGGQNQPSRYTENKVLFSVLCMCAREATLCVNLRLLSLTYAREAFFGLFSSSCWCRTNLSLKKRSTVSGRPVSWSGLVRHHPWLFRPKVTLLPTLPPAED